MTHHTTPPHRVQTRAAHLALTALLGLLPLAHAQQTQAAPGVQGTPGQRGPGGAHNPAFAATFDLIRTVNGLRDLDKDPKTAITRAEAKTLLPILKTLQSARTLPPATATSTLARIEDTLSDPQLTALDTIALKRQQAMRSGQGRQGYTGPRPGGSSQGQPGQAGTGPRPTRTPGMNPFLQGRVADGLGTLIRTLTARAK
ncbi:hypothetical protein [Deinococcus aquiradiocola]|uniref:Uncharacterized protein n=1 Tax=Deinococcus aquiradiocola TaxID=393059 RepID=A0A917PC88_9DEIO|nr:hypothetical protein [Deinococcus aquiradiocola]GGJ70574.1 hypothetical protein GCM10008939_13690 [Deinococcus aquiradiocola]